MKKYRVTLTAAERECLTGLIATGKAAAQKLTHARILLKADQAEGGPGWIDEPIAEALEVSVATVERVRQRFVEQGLEPARGRKKQDPPSRGRKLDGAGEARRIALACSTVPHGRATWTLGMLANKLAELKVVDSICSETVRQARQKNEITPWLKEPWCIPPQADAEFVCATEDVLEVYHRPYDAKRPQVCLDGTSPQLVGEVVQPIPAPPGPPERFEYESVRNGTANLFMISEPLAGWRHVMVTARRTAKDFAEVLRWLAEDVYREAEPIVLVMDNLSTHKRAGLYEAFPPEQARRIAERFEIHHTPKHGSGRNVAEIELSIRTRQCLDRRIESTEELRKELEPWAEGRNDRAIGVTWRFTTADARIKLRRLYPAVQNS